jgi:hypothetical protein
MSSLTLLAKSQKKNVNSTLKVYRSKLLSGGVNLKSLVKAQAPGLVSAGGKTNGFFGT